MESATDLGPKFLREIRRSVMLKIKNGDMVQIIKPLCVRRSNGSVENFFNRIVRVDKVEFKTCKCDLGLTRLICIPKTHLKKVA